MTGIYGADVAELRLLAGQFDAAAERLDAVLRELTGRVSAEHSWLGPDAGKFRSEWQSDNAPQLRGVTGRLREAATDLRRNADEQDRASSAGDAGAQPPTVTPHLQLPPLFGGNVLDPRKITVDGHNLWDLAQLGLSAVDLPPVAGDFLTAVGVVDSMDRAASAYQTGDFVGVGTNAANAVSGILKSTPDGSVTHLLGSAVGIWSFVFDQGAKADLSADGFEMVGDYIRQDPAGAAQGAMDNLSREAVNIVSAVL